MFVISHLLLFSFDTGALLSNFEFLSSFKSTKFSSISYGEMGLYNSLQVYVAFAGGMSGLTVIQ